METAQARLAGVGEAWRIRVVLVRLNPDSLSFTLVSRVRDSGSGGAWTADSLPAGAVFGVNAGQFADGVPWGWLVRDGVEAQPPGTGPLSMGVALDASGRVRLLRVDEIGAARASGDVRLAFQSYPALLLDSGTVPLPLRHGDAGVDVEHRDSRVALGVLRDGRVIVALTRFDALGERMGLLPFGPTVPEMAALMGALGCDRAVSLDGGLSGQLAIRREGHPPDAWPGLRPVPLALIAYSH